MAMIFRIKVDGAGMCWAFSSMYLASDGCQWMPRCTVETLCFVAVKQALNHCTKLKTPSVSPSARHAFDRWPGDSGNVHQLCWN